MHSSNAVFQIINQERLNGSACLWGSAVRLRHMATDHVLTVAGLREESSLMSPRAGGGTHRGKRTSEVHVHETDDTAKGARARRRPSVPSDRRPRDTPPLAPSV